MCDPEPLVPGLPVATSEEEVRCEVEEAMCEDFRRKPIDMADGIYGQPALERQVRKNPLGEPKLQWCKNIVR